MSRPEPMRRDAPERDEAPAPEDGAARVRLRFLPDGAEVRVPSGTPVFDAASWNGIAIDSTCGGHGTCKKCKVRVGEGSVPVGSWHCWQVPRSSTLRSLLLAETVPSG